MAGDAVYNIYIPGVDTKSFYIISPREIEEAGQDEIDELLVGIPQEGQPARNQPSIVYLTHGQVSRRSLVRRCVECATKIIKSKCCRLVLGSASLGVSVIEFSSGSLQNDPLTTKFDYGMGAGYLIFAIGLFYGVYRQRNRENALRVPAEL